MFDLRSLDGFGYMRAVDVTGPVDLVISGTNTSGQRVSIGVSMHVVQVAKTNGFLASLLVSLLFAVGSLFTILVLRRRDGETAILRDHP